MGKKTRGTIRESVRAGAQARGDSGPPSSPSDNDIISRPHVGCRTFVWDQKKPCEWCGASPGEYFLLAADGTPPGELICDDCATSYEKWMASECPPWRNSLDILADDPMPDPRGLRDDPEISNG